MTWLKKLLDSADRAAMASVLAQAGEFAMAREIMKDDSTGTRARRTELPSATLLLVGVLYVGLGLWCLIAPEAASTALGLAPVDASGRSEFLVLYGGLEIGLGLFFVRSSRSKEMLMPALHLLFITSLCLALTRLGSIVVASGLRPITYSLLAAEILLTAAGAVGLWIMRLRGSVRS